MIISSGVLQDTLYKNHLCECEMEPLLRELKMINSLKYSLKPGCSRLKWT